MKKFLSVLLASAMVLSLAACGSSSKANTVFGVDDLPGKTIGVQLGTTGDTYASDYESQGSTIERYSKGSDAVQSLLQGKIDCVIIDKLPAEEFVAKNSDKLEILDEAFALEEYAIAVAKENTELTASINEALKTLEENGVKAQIEANYIGDDTVGTCPYVADASNTGANGTLVMATNAYFAPYEYYEGGEIVGIDAEMAQAIADILGMTLTIEDMEFDSIIAAVQTGKADIGMAGMTVTEDRLKNIDFSDPYTTSTQVIIVRK